MKWTEDSVVPANTRPNTDVRRLVDTLAEHPGRWAEIDTYPAGRKKSAYSRGSQTVKRYPVLEYSVGERADDDGAPVFVLYFRVRP